MDDVASSAAEEGDEGRAGNEQDTTPSGDSEAEDRVPTATAELCSIELPDIHATPSCIFNMERLYATKKPVPADVRVSSGRSRVLRPVSF